MKIHNSYIFGESLDKKAWTAGELEALGKKAQSLRTPVKSLSRDCVVEVLSKAGRLFADPRSPWRREALKHLREHITFSPRVVESTLDVVPEILDRNTLLKRMNLEMFLPYAMETAVERRGYDGLVRAVPRGVVLHVGAGNVFLGILDSLVLGMLTRNVNIVKVASSGSSFLQLFMRAVKECDPKGLVAGSVAVLSWKGGERELEEAALKNADAVFVWGGYDAVKSYRELAPVGVRVEGFGPKTSFGVVFGSALANYGMAGVAERAARDACLWDQSACSSLHTLYLVVPGAKAREKAVKEFMAAASAAFSEFAEKMPQGRLSDDEKTEITRARQLAKADKALGAADYADSFPGTGWTVIYEKDPAYRISPLNRVLYVKAVEKVEDLRELLLPYKGYLQTAGVAGNIVDRKRALDALQEAGVSRVVKLGRMLEGVTGSPHDGIFPMMQLVNWIGIEERPGPLDRLIELFEHARERSPFYKRHFRGVGKVVTLEDFTKVPFLEKRHVLENTPPESPDLLTSKVQRGIYFASGGSTGQPKYVFYDQHEYDHTCRMLAYTYEAGGLSAGDTIANLFVAGNLWSSWLSVEKAIAYTKAISVPVGSNLPLENIARYLQDFKVTAVIGLPSFLVKLAEFTEANRGRFDLRIKKIFYGGEYVGDEMIKFFGRAFLGCVVRSGGYATADAGVIGFQCESCQKGLHHLFAWSQYIEFVDPDTLKPVPRGATGELIVTGLNKKHMPIIRYRVGDLGRWVDRPCACGRKEPLFEILGRCDDRIHVGGAHLFVADVQDAVGKVPGLTFNFQVVIEKKGHRDGLAIKAEAADAGRLKDAPSLAAALWESLQSHCEDLKESVRMGWLDRPAIEVLRPGAIERVQRTGKIRRVIDRRVGA